ncbi:MAG: fibronectin type III domain-containing protein [Candidatus Taylorbacteria bacterium]|nr:fibronectin type III domain-containing protein [Candidatus Taylorbacteria bacterium]
MNRKLVSGIGFLLAAIFVLSPLVSEAKTEISINRHLLKGMNGADVTVLQQLLASDKEIYPEGAVTGFFGSFTEKAVKRFQKKHNIAQVGQVGPMTLAKLQLVFTSSSTGTTTTVDLGNVNVSIGGKGKGNSINVKIGTGTSNYITLDHKIYLCHKGQTISVDYHALPAHIRHGDRVGICLGGGSVATSTQDLYVYNVNAFPSQNSANVNWLTNLNADSTVYLASSSPVLSALNPIKIQNATPTTNHTLNVINLQPNTFYYYRVVSKDADNRTATSSEYFFKTETVDEQVPFIFSVAANPVQGTTTVSWMTNEPTRGKVWFSTALDILNASDKRVVEDNSLSTSHSVQLGSLLPSTTYRFLITATDQGGNTATSTSNLFFFTTPAAPSLSLSGLTSTNVGSTTAAINWTTNNSGNSKVYFASTTPVMDSSNLQFVSESTNLTNHGVLLTGLQASTAYYYLAVSKDVYGQTATSSQSSFITQ